MPSEARTPGTLATLTTGEADEQSWSGVVADVQTDDSDYILADPWTVDPPPPMAATQMVEVNSEYAIFRNFGFSLPSNAHITAASIALTRGIQANKDGGNVEDRAAYLYNAGLVGNDLAASGDWPQPHAVKTYNLLSSGVTLTPDIVNSANFGFAIAVDGKDGPVALPYVQEGAAQAQIQFVELSLAWDFTGGGGGGGGGGSTTRVLPRNPMLRIPPVTVKRL